MLLSHCDKGEAVQFADTLGSGLQIRKLILLRKLSQMNGMMFCNLFSFGSTKVPDQFYVSAQNSKFL